MFESRFEAIVANLEKLRKLDPHFRAAHAAEHHRYQLQAPMPESEIETFETRCSVRLPEDFRTFLIQVSRGGAGPNYRIRPFSGQWSCSRVTRPFPHLQGWEPWEKTSVDVGWNCEDDDWDRDWLFDGSINICGGGCDSRFWLVLTGEERGHMWYSELDNEIGIWPVSGKNTDLNRRSMFPEFVFGGSGRLTFLDWYEHWLEFSLGRAEAGIHYLNSS
jgi:hypothetical protein